jgi:hypothetical protein
MRTTTPLGVYLYAAAILALAGSGGAAAADNSSRAEGAVTARSGPPAEDRRADAGKHAPPLSPKGDALRELADDWTLQQTPISEAEAARLLSSLDRSGQSDATRDPAAVKDLVACCFLFSPDLTVVEDDRSQLLWYPGYGWYWAYARGFDIRNIGTLDAGPFHVAVVQGANSYGFDVPGLAAGASQYFQITTPSYLGPACGTNAVIIVNPFNALPESNYNNNVATVAGLCLL